MFVDPGVKVNGEYYRDFLLSQQMIPAIKQVAGGMFVFQQDSAPAHRAHYTIQLLQRERRLTSLVLTSGYPTVQTWIPSTTRSGVSCSSGCMNHASTTSMSWSNVSTTSGMVCSRTSLTWLSVSGDSDWERGCVHMGDILNICCELLYNTNLRWKPIRANKLLLNFVY